MKDLTLRPYQVGMTDFALATPFCALFAEPGLGKTPTALTVMLASMYDRLDTARWLVVGPKLVVEDSWPRQLRMWRQFTGLTWRLLTSEDFGLTAEFEQVTEEVRQRKGLTFGGREKKADVKKSFRQMPQIVHLCPYHLLPWLVKAWGANWPYDGLVLDESLAVANSTSQQHKAVWQVAHRLGRVSRLIEMTGTPSPNSLEQLHGQIRLLDGGAALGKSKTDFQGTFMTPGRVDKRTGRVWAYVPLPGARESVQSRIDPLCMALRAKDYLDLPPVVINPIWVPLPAAAREQYDRLEADLVLHLEHVEVLAPSQGVLAAKLRQIANGAVYDTDSKFHVLSDFKLDRLEDLLAETASPVLCVYQFKSDWDRIAKRFGKAAIHVSTKGALDKFRACDVRMLCAHASAMEGVDGLQGVCSTLVWFGATFNARHWIQTIARLQRDGSTADSVVVHQLLAEDTVEERYAGQVLPERVEEQIALLEALKWRGQQG